MSTTTMQQPLERVLSLLKSSRAYTSQVHPSSRNHTAHCPAHNDKRSSLAVWEDETDSHVGLKCFAGCTRAAICEALRGRA